MVETLLTIFIGLVMLVGLAGAIIPILPDVVLIWAAALGYGFLTGWSSTGIWLFALITLLGLAGMGADILMSGLGARKGGASVKALIVGGLLGFVGLIFLTPIGGVVLLLVGMFTVEYQRLGDAEEAMRGILGLGLGYGASFGVKMIIGLGMIAAWLVWVFKG